MKHSSRTHHLTDAEFSDLLAGEFPDDALRIHLASCEYCRNELDCVRDSMSSFSSASTRWASAVAPARVPVPSRWAFRLAAVPSWTSGLAMTALTGVLVFAFGPAGRAYTRTHTARATVITAAPSNTELADDNRLMLSIDQELAYQDQQAVPASTHPAAAHSEHGASLSVAN